MKKIALLLALVMLLGVMLTACGETPKAPDPVTPDNTTEEDNKDKEEDKEEEYVPMGYRFVKFLEEDRKIINAQTLDSYVGGNFGHVKTGVKGIVIEFPGVDDTSKDITTELPINLALAGVVYAKINTAPWDWGSAGVVRFADLVVDALREKYSLDETVPVVAYGRGMGATSALTYAADSRHTVSAVAAEFPVADMERSLFRGENKIPRTFIRTIYSYDMPIKEALQQISLNTKVKYMPDIPYYIVGGTADELVESATLNKFANELKKRSKDVKYSMLDGSTHGDVTPAESGKVEMWIKKQATSKAKVAEKKEYTEYKNVTATVAEGENAGKAYEKYAAADAEIFTFENINFFTRNNLSYIEGEIKGIVMEFPGLGGSSCLGGHVNMGEYNSGYAQLLGKQGIAIVYMYCGPWSWGNKGVVRMADLCIDAIKAQYNLADDIPVVSTGGSMGGLGALMFTNGSRHNIVACMAACPCYDIIGEYNSFAANPSFPRTYLSAIYNYDMSLTDGLKAITPCENISTMPKVPYYIVCNVDDECFDDEGMQKFAKDMENAGHDVTIKVLPNTKHGQFTDEERESYRSFIEKSILG